MHNTLIVIGNGRQAIKGYLKDGIFDFEDVLPTPLPAKPEWRLENWGCLSPGVIISTDDPHQKVVCNFTTEGTPPLGIIRELISRYPHLRFVLYYEGDTFRGSLHGRRGRVTKESYREDRPAWKQ